MEGLEYLAGCFGDEIEEPVFTVLHTSPGHISGFSSRQIGPFFGTS